MTYQCRYCEKSFVKETSLAVHVCEAKRRHQEQSEVGVQLGLQAYLRFYEITQGSARLKTFDDFVKSPYYKAFVKFGRYCVDTRTINPGQFMTWLLKHNKKIDFWCSDRVYTEYLLDYLKVEAVEDALARAIEYSMTWAENNQAAPHDCLRYGNIHAVCHAISSGRLSPWTIYCSDSGQQFLASLHAQQVSMIWPYIDSDVWLKKLQQSPDDKAYAQQILTSAGW
jgi:hypothetical protein